MIKKNILLKYLENLCNLSGPSGREDQVAKYIVNEVAKLGYEYEVDNLGSVIVRVPTNQKNAPKVLIAAHMDEVGFLVLKINDDGSINAKDVGGMNNANLPSQRFRLINTKNEVFKGTISALAPHLNGTASASDMSFDFGFKNRKEAEIAGIKRLDMIVFDERFTYLNHRTRAMTKAFDDRYGCALNLGLLYDIKENNIDLPIDLYIAFTVQEEVGLRGIGPVVHRVKPIICICPDASPARDNIKPVGQGQLDKGLLIRYMDRGHLPNPILLDWQIKMCKRAKAPYQMFHSPGGTDANVAHKHLNGVFTLVHGIAVRNIHSASGVFSINDLLNAYKVLLTAVTSIDEDLVTYFLNGGM